VFVCGEFDRLRSFWNSDRSGEREFIVVWKASGGFVVTGGILSGRERSDRLLTKQTARLLVLCLLSIH
jgi:hypothetical protein